MNALRQIHVDAVPPQPWRNGGGLTRELLTLPAGGAWQLRISVADIRADGPFSAFPGVDRWFAVVEGEGAILDLDGQRHAVSIDSPPLHFDGAAAPACSLQGGSTRDLNLMCDRSAGRADMLRAVADEEWTSPAPWRALFTTTAMTLQIDDADVARVAPWTLLLSDHAAGQRWRAIHNGDTLRALWIEFTPRQAS